jgi:ribonuclease R
MERTAEHHGGRAGRGRAERKRPSIVIVHGEVQKNARGFAFLLHKPQDIFIPAPLAAPLLTGDTVKASIDSRTGEIHKIEISKRAVKAFIGTYEAGFDRRIVVLSDRTMREEVWIKERPNLPGLRHHDKVLVEITKYEPHLEGKITRSFGAELAPKLDTFAVVVRSQWPQEFSKEATAEAERLSREVQEQAAAAGYKGRKDLRDKHFVTIDGADARDFDDAVLVEKSGAGYVLYVAIADVSEFVIPETRLDEEAYARATSVYFPEWVIPMLPEALSNGACSLRPNEEKLTLTCEMHFDADGKKRSARIYESVIRSKRRCIYEDVQKEFEAGDTFWKTPYELYKHIRVSRNRRGSLDLDLPEAKVVLDAEGDTIDIRKTTRVDSHRLIEEFMIAANESVTEIMEREGWPFVFRVHEPPQAAALERFERFAMALGLKPKLGDGADPRIFSRFLESIQDNPQATTLSYLMLRSLKQARYDPVNTKHFGLASRAYTHFTSPIRRYPDLMVHRLLKRYTRHERFNGGQVDEFADYLVEACEHCSKLERKAEDLDRTVTKVKKARFMARHLGEELEARISNVNEGGLFVELEKWFVEGLVPIDELGGDYFEYVEERLMLRGKRTGRKFRIGDKLRVCVLRTDLDSGYVDFTLAENAIIQDRQASHHSR